MTQPPNILLSSVKIRDGHDNFFTPLRLIFAVLVMVGHAFAIAYGDADHEPYVFFDYTFSYLAVNLFFITSGFLVTGSMVFRGDKTAFFAARILRIFPALIVHVFLVMLVVGPLATSLPLTTYLTDPGLWLEPFKVLTFINTDMILPGAFETNGEQYGSAPLWTLRFEILCYIATLLAFSLGLMKRRWMVLAQFILPSLVWITGLSIDLFSVLPGSVENMVRFGVAYGLGATLFAYRDTLTFHWAMLPLLFGLCLIAKDSASMEVAVNLFLACGVMLITFMRVPKFNALKKLDDVSYGIYIYHWAVMQLAFYWFPELSVATLFVVALPVVVMLAWASWTYVEKPMLAYKKPFSVWLRFGRSRPEFDKTAVLLD